MRPIRQYCYPGVLILAACGHNSAALADCEDILKYVNYNTQRNYSQLNQQQVRLANFCTEHYEHNSSNKSREIEASYSLLHGDAKGTEQQIKDDQSKLCDDKFGSDYLASLGINQTEIVSPAAIDAVTACYNSREFHLTRLNSSIDSFSADFRWNGLGAVIFNSVAVSGGREKPAAHCRTSYEQQADVSKPVSIPSGSSVTVTCDRTSSVEKRDGVSYTSYPEGLVTVITQASSVAIPLIAVAEESPPLSRLVAAEKKIVDLSGAIEAQRLTIEKAEHDLITLQNAKFSLTAQDPREGTPRVKLRFQDEGKWFCPADHPLMSGFGHGEGQNDLWAMCAAISINEKP